MSILKIFKRRKSKLDSLVEEFFIAGYVKFAEAQQSAFYFEKEKERKNKIKERYEYLLWRKNGDKELSIEENNELEFCKFICEKHKLI